MNNASNNLRQKRLYLYILLCLALSAFSHVKADETDQRQAVWSTEDGLSLKEKKELEPYLREVAAKLEQSWHRPEHADSLPCVRFSLFENGGLSHFEVVTPSKDVLITKTCLEALVKACPYPPWPSHITRGGSGFETKFEFPVPQKDGRSSQDTSSVDQSSSTGGRDASTVNN